MILKLRGLNDNCQRRLRGSYYLHALILDHCRWEMRGLRLEAARVRKSFLILHCRDIMALVLGPKLRHSQFER